MKNDLFEKAKQAVAEEHGFSDFREYSYNVFWRTGSADSANREVSEWMCNEAVKALFIFRPVSDWHEDMGYCLFFQTPVGEPPAITCPGSSCWIPDYYTHFLQLSRFPIPDESGNPISGNYRYTEWLPFPQQPDGI